MPEYFLSPAKADRLPTDGGRPPAPTPMVMGMEKNTATVISYASVVALKKQESLANAKVSARQSRYMDATH